MRWKKNVNLDHLISRAWHFIRPEDGGEPWHELEARGGRGLPNAPSNNTDTRERWHLGGDPRGFEGQIYESIIYCRTRKKKFDLDHLIRDAWRFKGASLGTSQRRGAGEPYQTPQ